MSVLGVLHETATAIQTALHDLRDWGLAGTIDGQYRHDLVADRAGLETLRAAGYGVLSEESGLTAGPGGITVVFDPVDGSTNASRGIPWWNTSLCAVDDEGLLAAVVANQADGTRFEAVRGLGARRDASPVAPTGCLRIADAVIALNGYPPRHLGWKQYRALGAAALDLCAVASGVVDAYLDCTDAGLGPWDYLGGLLVCLEAGAAVAAIDGGDLVTLDGSARRIIAAAATPELLAELVTARQTFG